MIPEDKDPDPGGGSASTPGESSSPGTPGAGPGGGSPGAEPPEPTEPIADPAPETAEESGPRLGDAGAQGPDAHDSVESPDAQEARPDKRMDWELFYANFRKPDFVPGYEIQNRLGGGAFGDVYKARKSSIGKAYAIKFLKVEDEGQREIIQRELEQVRHLASMDHPNLVSIEDMGVVMEVPYLIMGYAGEDTLARRLRRERLSPESALNYFVQTCRGVLALHDRRLVHFDLKPSNIFLKGDVARVGDYGLAKLMIEGRQTLSFGRGTPHYMAPEMMRGRADHRADIYSLGVLLYESLCGELPFPQGESGMVLRMEDRDPVVPEGLPGPMGAAACRCLRLDPKDRFQSVNELLDALGQTARRGDSIVMPIPRDTDEASDAAWTPAPTPAAVIAARLTDERATPGAAGTVPTTATPSGVTRDAAAKAQEALAGIRGDGEGASAEGEGDPDLGTAVAAVGSSLATMAKGPGRKALASVGHGLDELARGGLSMGWGLIRLLLFLVFMVALGAGIVLLLAALMGSWSETGP